MTSYRHLTDAELLQGLDNVRHRSPIISDLCRRLEEHIAEPEIVTSSCECPVCKANLQAEYDEDNKILKLKVST